MFFKAAIAALTALALFAGALYWQNDRLRGKVEAYQEASRVLQQALSNCKASAKNIREDAESDREIDNIPDLRKFIVPDRWMLQPAAPAD